MKIFFVTGSFFPSQQGGPCNSVYALAKGLVKAGHSVRVITTNFDIPTSVEIPFDQWTEVDGIQVYYIRMPKTRRPFVLDLLFLTKPSLLLNILKKQQPDVMHATMLYTVMSHIAAGYAEEKSIPLIWSPRGSLLPYTFSRGRLKKKLFLSIPWVKKGLTGCHFHATSGEEACHIKKAMEKYTEENVTNRIHNIPNLVGDEAFIKGDDISPYPYKYILHLGRIHPKKDLEKLIEALSLAQIDPTIKLVIAGWTGEMPSYTNMLKRLVEKLNLNDRVIFTEKRVEGMEKATLYRHAEVFVLPSESENFGMVVLESLAQGVPVIASNKTPWQVLAEKRAGYWVGNDPASLAQSLGVFFWLNEIKRRQLSTNAKALASEYSNEALIGKYVKMYENVVRASHERS